MIILSFIFLEYTVRILFLPPRGVLNYDLLSKWLIYDNPLHRIRPKTKNEIACAKLITITTFCEMSFKYVKKIVFTGANACNFLIVTYQQWFFKIGLS